MKDKVFEYNGNHITFQLGNGDVMVNATQMAKPFGKQVYEYLRLASTEQLLEAIERKSGGGDNQLSNLTTGFPRSEINQLVVTINGGRHPGTWMHEDVALDFAQWLSIDFKLWCNDRLKELLKYGFTATDQTLDKLIAQPELGVELFTALKEEREKHAAELKNEQECSKLQWKMCVDQAKYIQELRESALIQKISERRYLFVAIEQQRLLKQNNIPIPTNLKISRRVYERDLKRLKM